MISIKNLNKRTKVIVLTLCLLCLCVVYLKSSKIYSNYKQKTRIQKWFNIEAINYDPENLHHGSAWDYLTAQEFKEVVLDGISRMDPQISKHDKIFELGVGVGAALKVIENYIGTDQLEIGGSDFSENAINQVKKIFLKQSDHFFKWDMTKRHNNIPDNYYDHVLSFGALAMYLKKDEMKEAIKEAVRITKPGGSMLFTHFIAHTGKTVGTIVCPIDQSFFEENAQEWGVENIKFYEMMHQGDRYQVTFRKKVDPS